MDWLPIISNILTIDNICTRYGIYIIYVLTYTIQHEPVQPIKLTNKIMLLPSVPTHKIRIPMQRLQLRKFSGSAAWDVIASEKSRLSVKFKIEAWDWNCTNQRFKPKPWESRLRRESWRIWNFLRTVRLYVP